VDTPRFPWRGLLIDTSRHYQSLDTIREAIRGLSYDKMNGTRANQILVLSVIPLERS
jgi:N-acetyl-beta-hexosaminidase